MERVDPNVKYLCFIDNWISYDINNKKKRIELQMYKRDVVFLTVYFFLKFKSEHIKCRILLHNNW